MRRTRKLGASVIYFNYVDTLNLEMDFYCWNLIEFHSILRIHALLDSSVYQTERTSCEMIVNTTAFK